MKLKSVSVKTVLILLTFFLGACQTMPYQPQARDVKRKPRMGGVIALPQKFRPEDRAKADELMKSNCQDMKLAVLEEGEVQTGVQTTTNAQKTDRASTERQVGTLFGVPLTTGEAAGVDSRTSSSAVNTYEWQIQYECQGDKKAIKR